MLKKTSRFYACAGIAALLCAACSGPENMPEKRPSAAAETFAETPPGGDPGASPTEAPAAALAGIAPDEVSRALEEIAELERSGGFVPGLGLAESNLRETSGDYAGAVLAVFKELSWAYSRGEGGVTGEAVTAGLKNVVELGAGPGAAEAARAVLAFFEGRWNEAQALIGQLFAEETETDAFSRWMLLVCAMEQGNLSREIRGEYSAIRARYSGFPEYWYRGARAFRTLKPETTVSAAGAYAERCVNLAGNGPYAAECRAILAETAGLGGKDGGAIKTRAEIEALVGAALRNSRPDVLAGLLPLVELPDNPYTIYASGALRALAADEKFRAWFLSEAAKAKGRLAERLLYISRG
ncbi:MAG: hypothetical protein LBP69_00040 [Treponema sp.]|jgi:hypothetical protein|nr:hypothetical protein [Treponema sp.]